MFKRNIIYSYLSHLLLHMLSSPLYIAHTEVLILLQVLTVQLTSFYITSKMHQALKCIEHIQALGKQKSPNTWYGFKFMDISSDTALHSPSCKWFTVYVTLNVSKRKREMNKSVSFHQCSRKITFWIIRLVEY